MQSPPLRTPLDASPAFNALCTEPIKMTTPCNETPIDDSGPTDTSIASYCPTVRPSPSPPRPQPHIRPHTTSSGAGIEWFCCFCSTPNSIASFAAAIAISGASPAALPDCSFCGITGCIDCELHAATPSQRDVPIVPTVIAMEIAWRREMAAKADEGLRRQMEKDVEERERETRRKRNRMERAVNWERMRGGAIVPEESWEDGEDGGVVYQSYEEEVKWAEAQQVQHGV